MNTFYYHGKSADNRRFTIGASINGDKMQVALSLCSAKDAFQRHFGIVKISERLADVVEQRGKLSMLFDTTTIASGEERNHFMKVAKSMEFMTSEGLKRLFNLHQLHPVVVPEVTWDDLEK